MSRARGTRKSQPDDSEVAALRQELVRERSRLAATEARLRAAEEALAALTERLASNEAAAPRPAAPPQRAGVEDRLGFKLLLAYWAWTDRLFPASSPLRRVYERITALLNR